MQIRNPCKTCIITVCCRERCEAKQDFWDTREWLSSKGAMIMGWIAVIVLRYTW